MSDFWKVFRGFGLSQTYQLLIVRGLRFLGQLTTIGFGYTSDN